jgi:hypothetical protein
MNHYGVACCSRSRKRSVCSRFSPLRGARSGPDPRTDPTTGSTLDGRTDGASMQPPRVVCVRCGDSRQRRTAPRAARQLPLPGRTSTARASAARVRSRRHRSGGAAAPTHRRCETVQHRALSSRGRRRAPFSRNRDRRRRQSADSSLTVGHEADCSGIRESPISHQSQRPTSTASRSAPQTGQGPSTISGPVRGPRDGWDATLLSHGTRAPPHDGHTDAVDASSPCAIQTVLNARQRTRTIWTVCWSSVAPVEISNRARQLGQSSCYMLPGIRPETTGLVTDRKTAL